MSTAHQHAEVTGKYLQKEINQLNVLGPFPITSSPMVHVNQFGVIPKKHQPGRW